MKTVKILIVLSIQFFSCKETESTLKGQQFIGDVGDSHQGGVVIYIDPTG